MLPGCLLQGKERKNQAPKDTTKGKKGHRRKGINN